MLNEKKLAWYAWHNPGGAGVTNNQGLAAAQNYAYFKNLQSQLFPNVQSPYDVKTKILTI